ncbi:MAG: acyl-CoA dehydrogenase family protein [Frankiales bacterium]|nr:acyl-CoA dehydrogenase family protein [Frankiales bacterium]
MGVSAEHRALAEAVHGLTDQQKLTLAARALADAESESLPDAWRAIAAQELMALPFDGTALDVCVALEAFGAACAPGPLLPTTLAALLVTQHGSDDLRARVDAGVRDGSMSIGVQIGDVVVGGASVSHVLLPVGGRWSFVEAAVLGLSSYAGIDPTRRVATIGNRPESVDDNDVLAGLTDDAVRVAAVVLMSAEACGVASWCVDTAASYAKVREQFGKPIGAFQGVKHRCAAMLAQLELARGAVWDAAAVLDDDTVGGPERELAASVAAAVALEAAVECAKSCIQVLGGIGFTWEHDAHLYLKRALAGRQLFGGTSGWRLAAGRAAQAGVRRMRSLDLGDDHAGLRAEVRAFIEGLPDDDRARRVAIADSGYLMPHWPAPYGRAAGPVEQLVIDEEFSRAGVSRPDLVIGNWAVPTILQYGTDEQRKRFVPPTLYGDIFWCQMFSEPGAGSDLASLQTKASRVEGGWSLSGQKVWTSAARWTQWAICLARTSTESDKHRGITYFLVDMKSPGLDVRPLRELTGDALFNEIFLSDVFVPDDCVIGEVDDGWRLARTTLANERVAMSTGSAFPSGVEDLLEALTHSADADDPVALTRVGELVCLAQAEAMLGVRATLARVSGTDPGAASSVRKLVGMHLRQDVSELALELLGPDAVRGDGPAAKQLRRFLANRSLTIAGGTSEVLHNIIGERMLGLPRG